MSFSQRSVPIRVAASALVLLALSASGGLAQDKQYGFDDTKNGGGKGEAFTAAESTKVSDTLGKMAALDEIVLKGEIVVDPAEIVADLRKMLEDGRMGKGKGAKDGKEKVNASTQRDGKATTAGDRMNVSDHFIKSATNEHLADVLAHEWTHTIQDGGTQAEREAIAYQVGGAMYLTKGGTVNDDPLKNDSFHVKKFKAEVADEQKKLPDDKTPAEGSDHCDCAEDGAFYQFPEPSKLFLWSSSQRRDSVAALSNRMFFSVHHLKSQGPRVWLLVTGCDTTSALSPVGVATFLEADATHFLSRTDVVLPQLRYPFATASSTDRQRVYLLDSHAAAPAVWIYQDMTGDSIPDQIRPLPFATVAVAGVAGALGILPATLGGLPEGVALLPLDQRGVDDVTLADPVTVLVDFDADGQADQSIPATYGEFVQFAPTIATDPRAGDTTVEVFAMNGHAIEIRATDASGTATLEVLGSLVVSGYAPVAVPLSRALASGEYVLAVDVTDNTSAAAPEQVLGAVPAVDGIRLALLGLVLAALAQARIRRRRGGEGSRVS